MNNEPFWLKPKCATTEMCCEILNLIKDFLEKKIDAATFEENFLEKRRIKIQNQIRWENEILAEGADRIFSAVDRFYPSADRDPMELDAEQLYAEVQHWATYMGLIVEGK